MRLLRHLLLYLPFIVLAAAMQVAFFHVKYS